MKKVEMVEKVMHFCDICGANITNEYISVCKICGRDHCKVCHETVKGSKNMLIGICPICNNMYDKFKKEMDEYYTKYDELYTSVANEIFDVWKKESLLIKNKGD